MKARNDFGETRVETRRKDDLAAAGRQLTYAFPPHSFTMLKGRIENP